MNCCTFYGLDLVDFHRYMTKANWMDVEDNFYYFMTTPSMRKKILITTCSPILLSALSNFSSNHANVTDLEITDTFLFRNYTKSIARFCTMHRFQNIIFKSSFDFFDIEPFLKNLCFMKVKRLSFHGCKMCPKTVKYLCRNLPSNTKELDLSSCSLNNSSIYYLSKNLQRKKSLQKLHLYSNRFFFDGVFHLFIALPKMSLVTLNLYGNRLGNSGMNLLIDHIGECDSLRELGLSRTSIYSQGLQDLCLVLPQLKLTSLYIANNFIDENDVQNYLLPSLPKTYISNLSWYSNFLSYADRVEIQTRVNKILERNLIKQKNHNSTIYFDFFLLQLDRNYQKNQTSIACNVFGMFDLSNYIRSFLLIA